MRKNIITDNLKVVHDILNKLNKNMSTRTDNDEQTNMLNLIKTNIDLNSVQLSEFNNTLI